jgi:hypothetical protein
MLDEPKHHPPELFRSRLHVFEVERIALLIGEHRRLAPAAIGKQPGGFEPVSGWPWRGPAACLPGSRRCPSPSDLIYPCSEEHSCAFWFVCVRELRKFVLVKGRGDSSG